MPRDPWAGAFAPPVPSIDVHVHLHPEGLARAIVRHFEARAWRPAYPFEPEAVADTLRARGVERFCFFSYAHKPGMARALNRWTAETARRLPQAVALGTLHVEDPDLDAVAREATEELGLHGFKFHCSVQGFGVDDARLWPVYERAEAQGHRFMLHAGTMPYGDTHAGVGGVRRVLARFPGLRACVAHMGAYETDAFLALLDARHPGLYLDTTMAMTARAAPYVHAEPARVSDAALIAHQDRILFGSDVPVIPYDYDEERRWAWQRDLPPAVRRKIFHDNALTFLGISPSAS